MSQLLHSPTLATVLMVEETIRDAQEVITIAELKRKLPRKVNHTTLKAILDYLYRSGKITFTPEGVLWTYVPPEHLAGIIAKGRTWES